MKFDLIVPHETRISFLKVYGADRADIPVDRSSDQRQVVENTHAPLISKEEKS